MTKKTISNITNQELLEELKARIVDRKIEIEWEVCVNALTYYDVKQKKRTRMSFSELLKK